MSKTMIESAAFNVLVEGTTKIKECYSNLVKEEKYLLATRIQPIIRKLESVINDAIRQK